MRFLILALFLVGSLNILGCDILGISNNGGETKPDTLVDVQINGKKWTKYYTENDSIVAQRNGANLVRTGEGNMELSIANVYYYESPYHETINIKIEYPGKFDVDTLVGKTINLHTLSDTLDHIDKYIHFTEWDYDVIIGEYNRYDPDEEATIEITEWNYEERQLEVEFDVTLLLDENVIEHRENYNTNDHYRRADTLDIEGTIRTRFEDHREN